MTADKPSALDDIIKRADIDCNWDHKEAKAELAALREKLALADRLAEAASAFEKRIAFCEQDENYKGVWTMAWVHGYRYTGPTYVAEIAAQRDALAAYLASKGGAK